MPGDCIRIQTGSIIPVDGEVTDGQAEVNEASMTGEAVPVSKTLGSSVFAGTVVENGNIVIRITSVPGAYQNAFRLAPALKCHSLRRFSSGSCRKIRQILLKAIRQQSKIFPYSSFLSGAYYESHSMHLFFYFFFLPNIDLAASYPPFAEPITDGLGLSWLCFSRPRF